MKIYVMDGLDLSNISEVDVSLLLLPGIVLTTIDAGTAVSVTRVLVTIVVMVLVRLRPIVPIVVVVSVVVVIVMIVTIHLVMGLRWQHQVLSVELL